MKRTERNQESRTQAPTARDLEVLASLSWAAILSRSQIEHLHFPSRRVAQRRMRALFDAGLVRVHVPSARLSDESVFTLSEAGLERLEELGIVAPGAVRLPRAPRLQKLAHTLACRAPWVALRRAESGELLRLVDYHFDADLADVPACTRAGAIPDGLAALERAVHDGVTDQPERVGLWFEVDTGSETTAQLRARLPSWQALAPALPGLLGCERVHLLLLVPNERRKATVERVLTGAADLGARVMVGRDLEPLLAGGYPFGLFAQGVRASRTAFRRATPVFVIDRERDRPAFRRRA